MAYNSISGYSTTRLTGLSSGLDTDSLIKASMIASQSKLDKMYQNKTKLEWKRDAYTDVRTKVSDFSSKFLSVLSPDNIFSKNTYKQFKVSMSQEDKLSSYFTVKGTASAQSGSHTITKATMATAATLAGEKHRNHVAGMTGATNTNMKAGSATSTKLYVKDSSGDYKELDKSDLANASGKISEVYVKDSTSKDGYTQAFGNTASFTVNGKTINASSLKDMQSALSEVGISLDVTADGQLKFTGSATGVTDALKFEDSLKDAGVFGKNGKLGVTELKPESVITSTSMTLGDLAKARDENPSLDKNGNPVKNDLNGGNLSFKINGVQFDFKSTDSIQKVLDDVTQSSAGVTMTYDEASGQFMLRGDEGADSIKTENVKGKGSFFGGAGSLTGIAEDETKGYPTIDRGSDTLASAASKMGLSFSNGKDSISFKINGQSFTFNKNVTLDKMMSEINSNSDAKVRMTYSQITDSFEITSLDTGHAQKVTFETDDADAKNLFGFTPNADGTYTARGTDATLEIDGETITRASNKFVIDGLEITIKDNFVADTGQGVAGGASEAGLGKAKFSVTQDVDSVVDKMKAFVTAYNELVDSLYKMTTEQRDYDYDALTEDQRDNMEKEDIEKWETEAKKGILHNDTTIRSFLSKMRSAIFEKIGGTGFNDITGSADDKKGLSAYDLGFNTTTYAAGEYGGKLTFNEDKFRAALERDPEAVANVMAQVSDSSDKATEYKESGFATKLYDMMSDFTSTMRSKNISNVNDQISSATKAMQTQLEKMYDEQERLYKQYAALETLMTNYQSQMTWMQQQFASLTTSS